MSVPPNVIFIITDDQGYGDIGYHSSPQLRTPNLDDLARECVQLDNHHHDPLCSPSRAALLTGQYASRNGVWHVIHGRHLLDPEAVTMADIFSQNGYRTGMFGKWHLGDNYPFAPQYRGFDEVVCHRGGGIGELPDFWANNYIDDVYFRNGEPVQYQGYCTDVFFEEAKQFIAADSSRPFFVYLATNAMHAPHIVPERYSAPYHAQGIEADRANFYGMITNFDENIGAFMRSLQDLGLDENTIVIFTSDHGTAAGYDPATGDGHNAGMRGKKGSVFEGGHRVNFFLRWKGNLPAEHKIQALTAHIDILPTLIDLCNLENNSNGAFDGVSLLPQIHDHETDLPERSVFVHLQPDQPQKWHHSVVMRGSWRLINGEALYDVETDPSQKHNVKSEFPEMVAALRRDYRAWWASLEELFKKHVYIPVGSEHENPVLLSARDWHPTQGRVPWRQDWISDPAFDANGFWMIEVRRAGRYRLELRCYPREADMPTGASHARLQIGAKEIRQAANDGDTSAIFFLELPAGKTKLQTWLGGHSGRQERGAYYVYITRMQD